MDKLSRVKTLLSIAKYSGCDIRIVLNPFQWAYVPKWRFGSAFADEAFLHSDFFKELSVRFLFLSLMIWIDGNEESNVL